MGSTASPGADRAARARDRDRRHVWHPWSPLDADRAQLLLDRGEGHRVWDVDGAEHIDASSLNAVCGYGHPEVAAAAGEQMARLHHFDLSTGSHEPAGLLAERLAALFPTPMARTLLVNSGSEGIEAALMIAVSYWAHQGRPRRRVVAFSRGYHGSTTLSRSLSVLPRISHLLSEPMEVTLVDLPVPDRRVREPEALRPLLAAFERAVAQDGDIPAAVVVEPFLNVGGGIVLPDGFLRGLRELCDAAGTLLIADEVFTGYARTGRMFACQREDVDPDIIVSSKGLNSGYVPIAAVGVREAVHDTFRLDPVIGGLRYGHTTSGHPVACAAALATLDVIEREKLPERAEQLGARLLDRLAPLAGRGLVEDVRGQGLAAVLETSSPEAAAAVALRARAAGLLLRQQGPVVMAVPPLTVDEPVVDDIADRVLVACDTAA